jgi:protein-S-isoprenylcysteine O-methyltransferase Ste14
MLVAWAVFLAAPWSLVGPIVFVLYISRFQIAPEERVLESIFGEAYGNYKVRVHRWL